VIRLKKERRPKKRQKTIENLELNDFIGHLILN